MAVFGSPVDCRVEHAGDRRLLDHRAGIAGVQAVEQLADRARLLDELAQIGAGALLAGRKPQHRVLEAGGDQIVLERALVLQIVLGLAARHLVERRLGDVEMAALDQLRHLPVEEGQQQRADVGPSTSASVMMMILW